MLPWLGEKRGHRVAGSWGALRYASQDWGPLSLQVREARGPWCASCSALRAAELWLSPSAILA